MLPEQVKLGFTGSGFSGARGTNSLYDMECEQE